MKRRFVGGNIGRDSIAFFFQIRFFRRKLENFSTEYAESRFTRKKEKKKKKKRKERRSRMENKYLRLDCAQLKTPSMEFARCIVSQDRREASLHHPGSALLPAPGFLSTLIYREPSNQSLCTLEDVDVSNCNGS